MRQLFHSLGVVSLLALCAVATPGHAQSQDNTFSGALAPAHNPGETKQPEGYRGVMPGHVAAPPQQPVQAQTPDPAAKPAKKMPRTAPVADDQPDAAAAAAPTARTPRNKHNMSTPDGGMSVRPGFEKHKALTAEDLKQIAAMTGIEVHLDQIPENMANAIHMPAHVYPIVSLPQPRIDGMLPLEFSAKQMVDKEMQDVSAASNLSPEAHRKALGDAVTVLSNFAHSARVKRDMPAEIYQTMGVPSTYINESHEGAAKAAERLEAAIKTLQQQQQ